MTLAGDVAAGAEQTDDQARPGSERRFVPFDLVSFSMFPQNRSEMLWQYFSGDGPFESFPFFGAIMFGIEEFEKVLFLDLFQCPTGNFFHERIEFHDLSRGT